MKRLSPLVISAFCLVASVAFAAPKSITLPTAKQALELANAQLETNTQNQVILIEGCRSDSDLRPRRWEITFYEPQRINAGLIVHVKDGAVVRKEGAVRLFDDARWKHFGRNFSGYYPEEIINLKRWKLDSDEIVRKAQSHPKLAGLQVTEVTLALRKPSDGDVPPVWTIKVRARPPQDPKHESWVGYLKYNAEDGELLADDLDVEELTK